MSECAKLPFEKCTVSQTELSACLYLMTRLDSLRQAGEYCDLVFELGSKSVSAHRVVLVSWSPVMEAMLRSEQSGTQHVNILYDQHEAFLQFVTFLYTGRFDEGDQTDIAALLLLASTFQINLLRSLCEGYLDRNLTVDNVIGFFHLAVKYNLSDLETKCVLFLKDNLADAVCKTEFRDLTPGQFNTFLASRYVSKLNPEMKLFLIISWLRGDVGKRQQYLVMLLGHLDWEVVAKDFLLEISQTENFFTSNPASLYLLLQTLHSAAITLGPYTDQFKSLRHQYSYLLATIVTSSTDLGSVQPRSYQPLELFVSTENGHLKPTLFAAQQRSIKTDKDEDFISIQTKVHCNIITVNKQSEIHVQKDNTLASSLLSSKPPKIFYKPGTSGKKKPSSIRKREVFSKGSSYSLRTRQRSQHCFALKRKRTNERKPTANESLCSSEDMVHQETSSTNMTIDDFTVNNIHSKRKGSGTNVNIAESTKHVRSARLAKRRVMGDTTLSHPFTTELQEGNAETDGDLGQVIPQTKIETQGGREQHARIVKKMKTGQKDAKKSVRSKTSFKTEIQTTDESLVKLEQCDCSTSVPSHVKKHTKNNHYGQTTFLCPLCEFTSKLNKQFMKHLNDKHFPGPPFSCDNCSFSTNKMATLLSHRRQHTDERPYVCDMCLTAFRTQNNLYAHLKIHSEERKFVCPVCSRSFKVKNTLDQHLVTHSDLRPYLCDLCGFSTKYQSHLIAHRRIHSGEVFSCDFPSCSYSTPRRSQLKSHMRCHSGVRSHVCSTCGKSFVEKSHLVRHEQTHSAVKSHACSLCDYASYRVDKLREHVKKYHPDGQAKPLYQKKDKSPKKYVKVQTSKKQQKDVGTANLPAVQKEKVTNEKLTHTQTVPDSAVVLQDIGYSTEINHESVVQNTTAMSHGSGIYTQFKTEQSPVEGTSVDVPVGSDTTSLYANNAVKDTSKPERDMSAVEFLTRMGFSLSDIDAASTPSSSNVGDLALPLQVQFTDSSSDEMLAGMSYTSSSSSTFGNMKPASYRENFHLGSHLLPESQPHHYHIQHGDLNHQPYQLTMSPPSGTSAAMQHLVHTRVLNPLSVAYPDQTRATTPQPPSTSVLDSQAGQYRVTPNFMTVTGDSTHVYQQPAIEQLPTMFPAP